MVQCKVRNGIVPNYNLDIQVSQLAQITEFYNPFPAYSYTGSVRPVYPLSGKRTVPRSIRRPDYADTGIPKNERLSNRAKFVILDVNGQEAMRKVCRLARQVLDIVAAKLKPGISTDYLDEICHDACIKRNVSTTRFKIMFITTKASSHILLP